MNIFQWLAGADKDILSKCSRGTKVKISGYGTLVLIPAIIGLFSMSYAISTIANKWYIYIPIGIVWFLLIVAIDRFIVSTLHKSTLNRKGNFAMALMVRIIFAIVVGISVSHPVVLLWFNKGINEKITKEKRTEVSHIDSIYTARINNAHLRLETLKEEIACNRTLKTAEQSGHKVSLPCGYSSGIPGSSTRTDNIQKIIDNLAREIKLETDNFNRIKDELNRQKGMEIASIEESKSYDYLSRVRKLSELENDPVSGDHIFWVKIFIILFFVFLDILPITMKAATAYGEYEAGRDKILFDKIETLNMDKEISATFGKTAYMANARARIQHQQKINELNDITGSTNEFLDDQEKQRIIYDTAFELQAKRLSSIKDTQLKKDRISLLNKDRDIFKKAAEISQNNFLAYLSTL